MKNSQEIRSLKMEKNTIFTKMGCRDHKNFNLKHKYGIPKFFFNPQANGYEFVVAWQGKYNLAWKQIHFSSSMEMEKHVIFQSTISNKQMQIGEPFFNKYSFKFQANVKKLFKLEQKC